MTRKTAFKKNFWDHYTENDKETGNDICIYTVGRKF